MYSVQKNVQIVVASLKAHGVKFIVHCPGGADMPCYSMVDERSALYFGIGLSMANGNAPVAVLCTSGTAVSNFHSGMEEAFYKRIPIVAITADRSPYLLDQYEIQKIDQRSIFSGCTKCEVDLPIVNTSEEAQYCDRLVNTALLEMESDLPGPVHINVPTIGLARCVAPTLPSTKVIKRHRISDDMSEWELLRGVLEASNKILVIVGENTRLSDEDRAAMEQFHELYGCVYSVEHMSNYKGRGSVITYRATEAMTSSAFDKFTPDLVIDFGGHIATVKLKTYLRERAGKFQHWSVREDGSIRDGFMSLTDVFACTPGEFFRYYARESTKADKESNKAYYHQWNDAVNAIIPPVEGLSNFRIASELASAIPNDSYLDLGILNSVRVMQFFDLDPSVTVSANIGGLGIDGCLSTAVGKAAATDKKVFIMQGDLSFFYDMNALNIRYIGNNLRILVVNNGGGGEFHIGGGRKVYPDIDDYLAAKHNATARGWANECGFHYLSARTIEELRSGMDRFVGSSDKPMLFEVFTDRDFDAQLLDSFYEMNSGASPTEKAKSSAKFAAKRILSFVKK